MALPKCACGAEATRWKPGTEPEFFAAEGCAIAVDAGEQDQAWCMDCWPYKHQAQWNSMLNGGA